MEHDAVVFNLNDLKRAPADCIRNVLHTSSIKSTEHEKGCSKFEIRTQFTHDSNVSELWTTEFSSYLAAFSRRKQQSAINATKNAANNIELPNASHNRMPIIDGLEGR